MKTFFALIFVFLCGLSQSHAGDFSSAALRYMKPGSNILVKSLGGLRVAQVTRVQSGTYVGIIGYSVQYFSQDGKLSPEIKYVRFFDVDIISLLTVKYPARSLLSLASDLSSNETYRRELTASAYRLNAELAAIDAKYARANARSCGRMLGK